MHLSGCLKTTQLGYCTAARNRQYPPSSCCQKSSIISGISWSLLNSLSLSLSRPGSHWDCPPFDGSRVPLSSESKDQGCIEFWKFSIDGSRVLPRSVFTDHSCINPRKQYFLPSIGNMLVSCSGITTESVLSRHPPCFLHEHDDIWMFLFIFWWAFT